MIKQILSSIFALMAVGIYAQAPDTAFARCYGGSLNETNGLTGLNNLGFAALSAAISADSSVFITTQTSSTDGFVTTNKGEEDVWVIKLNPQGDTLWTKVFGGTSTERSYKILALADGGCILVGRTTSINGDFTGAQFGPSNDAFVIRLNANGGLVWKKRFGGSQDDMLYSITPNGNGFIAVGETGSIDGDLNATLAGYSCGWVLALDANGTLQWSVKTNGVIQNEDYIQSFWNVAKAADASGWYVIGITGNFADPNSDDILFTKFDNTGNLLNKTTFGSASGDGIGGIATLANGNLIMAGRAGAATGGQTYIGGPADAWLVTVDVATGQPISEKLVGGTDWESFYDITTNSVGEVYALGFTRSTNNFASAPAFGLQDTWLVKFSALGDTLYTSRLGGSDNDVGMAICKNETALYAVGRTNSTDGAVTGNNGGRDVWVIKYQDKDEGVSVQENKTTIYNLYPNPTNGNTILNIASAKQGNVEVSILNLLGQVVYSTSADVTTGNTSLSLPTQNLSKGVYTVVLTNASANPTVSKLIKQ